MNSEKYVHSNKQNSDPKALVARSWESTSAEHNLGNSICGMFPKLSDVTTS
jgi:hypothetical protein